MWPRCLPSAKLMHEGSEEHHSLKLKATDQAADFESWEREHVAQWPQGTSLICPCVSKKYGATRLHWSVNSEKREWHSVEYITSTKALQLPLYILIDTSHLNAPDFLKIKIHDWIPEKRMKNVKQLQCSFLNWRSSWSAMYCMLFFRSHVLMQRAVLCPGPVWSLHMWHSRHGWCWHHVRPQEELLRDRRRRPTFSLHHCSWAWWAPLTPPSNPYALWLLCVW